MSLPPLKIWREGTYDITYTKILFLHDYWTNSHWVFADMQMIKYNFIVLNRIQNILQVWKLFILKVRL